MNKNNQVNAQVVIVELQKEIADKALQIALLKAQLKAAKKVEAKPEEPVEGDEQ